MKTKMKIVCPHCTGEYLWIVGYQIFLRDKPGKPGGDEVGVYSGGDVVINREGLLDCNPSSSLDGARIEMNCERCGKHAFLSIAERVGKAISIKIEEVNK